LTNAKIQEDVLLQVAEKERFKKREYQETMIEERAMKMAELEYRARIDVQKVRNEGFLR
jgi:hypothetical protein